MWRRHSCLRGFWRLSSPQFQKNGNTGLEAERRPAGSVNPQAGKPALRVKRDSDFGIRDYFPVNRSAAKIPAKMEMPPQTTYGNSGTCR